MKPAKSKISTNNLIAIAIVVAILSLLALGFAGRILAKKIILEGKIIAKKSTASKQLDKNLATLPTLASNYQSLGTTKDLINQALPSTTAFPSLLTTVESIAAVSNVELDSVDPALSTTDGSSTDASAQAPATTDTGTGSTDQTEPQDYGFSVNVKGHYSDIVKFAQNLQLSARPIKVTNLQLTGTTDELIGTIQMTTFYYQPQVLQDKTEVVK